MNFKKALLVTLLVVCPGSVVHAENQMQQPAIDQELISAMMNRMYDLIMPEYKKVYKKYFDEIEWLEHVYIMNVDVGNALIIKIAQEFSDVLASKIDEFINVMFAEMARMQEMPPISAEEKKMFGNMMMQIMPTAMVQGLKKNAELKSSVYQELTLEAK